MRQCTRQNNVERRDAQRRPTHCCPCIKHTLINIDYLIYHIQILILMI